MRDGSNVSATGATAGTRTRASPVYTPEPAWPHHLMCQSLLAKAGRSLPR